jgi:hypothetical protein
MKDKNVQGKARYLVLEVGDDLNSRTKSFFEKKKKSGENFEYELLSPLKDHGTVTSAIKFGGFDFVTIEPTVYRTSLANKIAHDFVHSMRTIKSELFKDDPRVRFKKLYLFNTKEELANGMLWLGPDGIGSVGGIIEHVPTYIMGDSEEMRLLETDEFFKIVRPILYSDNNVRFYSEVMLGGIRKAGNPQLKISKPDIIIPFVIVNGMHRTGLYADVHGTTPTKLLKSVAGNCDVHTVHGGYIHVFHGSKTLCFVRAKGMHFYEPEDLFKGFASELAVHYPEYHIEVDAD